MSTFIISILGASTLPDTSGNVYPEPVAVNLQSNKLNPNMCFVFRDTSTTLNLGYSFRIPQNYVGTAKLILRWATTVTSGKVVWETAYTAVAAGATSDPAANTESTTSTGTTVPGTTRLEAEDSITLTSGNFAVGNLVQGVIIRNGADGNDTAAASAYLLGAWFSYADV